MEKIYKKIKDSGGRLTKIKKAIINLLSENHCLLSKKELVAKLKAKKIYPNRSTIYRELQFLTNNGVVIKNTISGTDYYEIPKDRHHHIICLKCKNIKKVEIGNYLKKQGKKIVKENKFIITNYSIEFYGYCHKCQINKKVFI